MNFSTPGFPVLLYCLELSFTISQRSPLSRCSHLTISSSVTHFSSCPQSFLASKSSPTSWLFAIGGQSTGASASVRPSNEYSGLISFRMDWLDLLESPRDSQESSPRSQFKSISSSALSLLYGPTLTSIHDYWKIHSSD